MKIKKAISYLVLTLLTVWVIYFIAHHPDEFEALAKISASNLFLLMLSAFVYLFLQGLILNKALDAYNINLSIKEWFGLLSVTMLGNYIVPFSGIGFRAKYLKDKHGLSYKNFSISLAAIFLIELMVFINGGVVALIYLYLQKYSIPVFLTIFLLTSSAILLLVFLCNLRLPFPENSLAQKINSLLESWREIKKNKAVIRKLFFYTIALYLVSAYMFYVAYHAFHFNITYFASLLPTSLSDVSFILRITPGSIGTYDGSIIYASTIIGLTLAQGILVAGIIRMASMFWIFLCGPIFSYLLLNTAKGEKYV